MSKIYVGQLSDQTSQDTLRRVFGEYGGIKRVEMRTGFAFITFDSDDLDLERLINEMNDKDLDGSRIRVEKERGTIEGGYRGFDGRMKPPKRLDLRVLIRGLHPKVDWKDLKDWARDTVGEVTYSNVFDREGQHMGLIELKDEASFEKALATLGEKPLLGVTVTVEKDAVDSEYSRIPPANTLPPGHFRGHPTHHHNQNNNYQHGRGRDFYPPTGRDFRALYNEPPAPYGRPGDHHLPPGGYHRGDRGPYPHPREHSRDRDFRDRDRDRDRERDYGRDFRSYPPAGGSRGGDFRGGAPPDMMRGDDRFYSSSSRYGHLRDLPPPPPRDFGRGYHVRRSRSRSRSRDRFNNSNPPPAGNRR